MENLETTAGGLPALQDASAEELAQAIYDVLDAKKAHDVKLLPVGDKTVLAEYFVICTGNSSTQVKALADRKSTRLNSSHDRQSRMPSSA